MKNPRILADKMFNLIMNHFPDPKGLSVEDIAMSVAALNLTEVIFRDFLKEQGFEVMVGVGTEDDVCPVHGPKGCPTTHKKEDYEGQH